MKTHGLRWNLALLLMACTLVACNEDAPSANELPCDFSVTGFDQIKVCVAAEYPVGSSFDLLDKALQASRYVKTPAAEPNRFNYILSSNSVSNFKIQFLVSNSDGKITDLSINP